MTDTPPANDSQPLEPNQDIPASQMPLFYSRPVPIDPDRHADMVVRQTQGFEHAINAIVVPINFIEAPLCARSFPIVFSLEETPLPMAVLGFEETGNLFTDKLGRWRPGIYVPAYIRRYPFILINDPSNERWVLGVDETPRVVVPAKRGGAPLVEGREGSEFAQGALSFCLQYHEQFLVTSDICGKLKAAGVLEESHAAFTGPTGKRLAFGTFNALSAEKLEAVLPETFLEWRKLGWLRALYAVVNAQNNWNALLDLSQNRNLRFR